MKKVFIVHGFQGTPNTGWKSWLFDTLGKNEIFCCSLPMPSPDFPKKDEWVTTIKYVSEPKTDEIILVGHSLGAPAILRYLETLQNGEKIKGVILVAGPYKKLKEEDQDSIIRRIDNFFDPEFNYERIKLACDNFIVIHAKNDDRVPFSHAEFLSKALSAKLVGLEEGGHLSNGEGVHELPEALEEILKMIKE